jgi:hypothetical protein
MGGVSSSYRTLKGHWENALCVFVFMYYQAQLCENTFFLTARKSNGPDSLDKLSVNFHQRQIY